MATSTYTPILSRSFFAAYDDDEDVDMQDFKRW